MNTVQIPGVSFPVSRVCLGCAFLGTRESREQAFEIMDYYYSKGGRFFNTAHEYGGGLSERCLGDWVRERGVRNEVVLTSKGGEDVTMPNAAAAHREDLLQDIDESLSRMGLDYLDFYMLHVDDLRVGVDEIVSTMEEIMKSGKIRHYGCSNWTPERQRAAAAYAREHGMQGFVIDEIEFNLARSNQSNQNISKWLDESYIQLHEEDGVCVGAYSSVASGLFEKYIRAGGVSGWHEGLVHLYDNPYNRELAERMKKLSSETGWTTSQIMLAWLAQHPYKFPTFALMGASRVSQLEDSLAYESIVLTPEMKQYLRPDWRDFPEGKRI